MLVRALRLRLYARLALETANQTVARMAAAAERAIGEPLSSVTLWDFHAGVQCTFAVRASDAAVIAATIGPRALIPWMRAGTALAVLDDGGPDASGAAARRLAATIARELPLRIARWTLPTGAVYYGSETQFAWARDLFVALGGDAGAVVRDEVDLGATSLMTNPVGFLAPPFAVANEHMLRASVAIAGAARAPSQQ